MTTLIFWIWLVVSIVLGVWVTISRDVKEIKPKYGLLNSIISGVIMFALWPIILTILVWSMRKPESKETN